MAGTALRRQPEEKEKCPRASTLSNALFTGGWGRGDSTFERLACWLILGGEGERIMLQELPLSSCYSPRCMHNLRRIL